MPGPLIQEVIRRATTPLVPQISQGWRLLADLVDNPRGGSSNVPLETLKGLAAGTTTGLGEAVGNLTSPLGAASMVVGQAAAPSYQLMRRAAALSKLPAPSLAEVPPEFWPVGAEGPSRWATLADLLTKP